MPGPKCFGVPSMSKHHNHHKHIDDGHQETLALHPNMDLVLEWFTFGQLKPNTDMEVIGIENYEEWTENPYEVIDIVENEDDQ